MDWKSSGILPAEARRRFNGFVEAYLGRPNVSKSRMMPAAIFNIAAVGFESIAEQAEAWRRLKTPC